MSDAIERYERLASEFYAETGMLAPGKDDVLGAVSYETRAARWALFLEARDPFRRLPEDNSPEAAARLAASDARKDAEWAALMERARTPDGEPKRCLRCERPALPSRYKRGCYEALCAECRAAAEVRP